MKTFIVEKKKTTLHFPLAFEKYGTCTILKMDYDYPEKPKEDEGFILVDNNKQAYMPFTKKELLELCPYGKKGDTVLIKEKYSTGRGTKVKIIDVRWKTNPWCWEVTYANK